MHKQIKDVNQTRTRQATDPPSPASPPALLFPLSDESSTEKMRLGTSSIPFPPSLRPSFPPILLLPRQCWERKGVRRGTGREGRGPAHNATQRNTCITVFSFINNRPECVHAWPDPEHTLSNQRVFDPKCDWY